MLGKKKPANTKDFGDLSSRLSDIDLKLDHIIDGIKDSLHRLKRAEKDNERELL